MFPHLIIYSIRSLNRKKIRENEAMVNNRWRILIEGWFNQFCKVTLLNSPSRLFFLKYQYLNKLVSKSTVYPSARISHFWHRELLFRNGFLYVNLFTEFWFLSNALWVLINVFVRYVKLFIKAVSKFLEILIHVWWVLSRGYVRTSRYQWGKPSNHLRRFYLIGFVQIETLLAGYVVKTLIKKVRGLTSRKRNIFPSNYLESILWLRLIILNQVNLRVIILNHLSEDSSIVVNLKVGVNSFNLILIEELRESFRVNELFELFEEKIIFHLLTHLSEWSYEKGALPWNVHFEALFILEHQQQSVGRYFLRDKSEIVAIIRHSQNLF